MLCGKTCACFCHKQSIRAPSQKKKTGAYELVDDCLSQPIKAAVHNDATYARTFPLLRRNAINTVLWDAGDFPLAPQKQNIWKLAAVLLSVGRVSSAVFTKRYLSAQATSEKCSAQKVVLVGVVVWIRSKNA